MYMLGTYYMHGYLYIYTHYLYAYKLCNVYVSYDQYTTKGIYLCIVIITVGFK